MSPSPEWHELNNHPQEGSTCCHCGAVIEGSFLVYVFCGHHFKANQINGHNFCTSRPCNTAAWAEFAGRRTGNCRCGRK